MSSPLQDGSIATNDVIEAVHINQLFPILADLEDGKAFFRPDQGSANAYQVDFSGTPSNKNQFSTYHQGMLVIFKAANTNTGASTLQVVGPSGNLTALPLTKSGSVALEADDIQAGQMVAAVCNDLGGGNFRFEMVGAPAVNLTAGDIPSGVDASKIGAGSVSNTEFGYLDGVTSGIQGQIDGKAPSSHTHAASDIASGQVALARGGTGADLSATGGAGQVLKQSSAGGAVSVSALTASDMPSSIDASKIGSGSVSNTEFGYLDGVTSSLQAQIDGKAPSSHTHAASDIASGQVALARGGTGADLSATGGAGQVLKQSSAGGAVSVSALTAGDIPNNIDAVKIGSGAVSNTEFGYLDGVTGGLQAQLDGKEPSISTLPTSKGGLGIDAGSATGFPKFVSGVASIGGLSAADIVSGNLSLQRGGMGSDFSGAGAFGKVFKKNSASAPLKLAYPTWVGCKVRSTSNTTLNSGNTIFWPTAMSYNFPGMHSTTTNTNRLVAPVTGVYRISAQLSFWFSNGTGNFWVRFVLRQNGNTTAASQVEAYRNSQVNMVLSINTILDLSAGEYIDFAYFGFGSVQANYSSGDGLTSWAILELVGVSHANDLSDDNAGGGIIVSSP